MGVTVTREVIRGHLTCSPAGGAGAGQVLAPQGSGVTLVVPGLPEEGPPELSHSLSGPQQPPADAQPPGPAPRRSLGRTRLCLFRGPPVGLPRSLSWSCAVPARFKLAGFRAGPGMPFPAHSTRGPGTWTLSSTSAQSARLGPGAPTAARGPLCPSCKGQCLLGTVASSLFQP